MANADFLLHELSRRGGVATRAQLRGVSDRELARAVGSGVVNRDAIGRYSLATADQAHRLAVAARGARSHRSAALAYGWAVATAPTVPEITVRRGRNVSARLQSQAVLHWRPLSGREIDASLTGPLRTVVDCLRDLPVEEGVPVADSALRSGVVGVDELHRAAQLLRGPGSGLVRHRVGLVEPLSANPFESRLRLIGGTVPGLQLRPQVWIVDEPLRVRVDLADTELGIVAEADSFEWHGGRAALAADAWRYDALAVRGWLVLRFSFEAVFAEPDRVAAHLDRAVRLRSGSAHRPWSRSVWGVEPEALDWPA